MILILLAFTTLNLTKTEIFDTLETSEYGDFIVVTMEIWEGEIEWDAEQGDSLITSGIPIGVYDYYKIDIDGISDMIVGWFIDSSNFPIDEWEVAISNTGSTDRIFKAFRVWDKWKMFFGFRARTTDERTVKFTLTKFRIGG